MREAAAARLSGTVTLLSRQRGDQLLLNSEYFCCTRLNIIFGAPRRDGRHPDDALEIRMIEVDGERKNLRLMTLSRQRRNASGPGVALCAVDRLP